VAIAGALLSSGVQATCLFARVTDFPCHVVTLMIRVTKAQVFFLALPFSIR
jgi:hypothetical protein